VVEVILIHPNEPKEVRDYLTSQSIPWKDESRLPFDYLFAVGEHRVAVERKESPDFVQSIMDARLFEQLYYMSVMAPLSYVVVIGNITEALIERGFRRESYIGALISSTLKVAPEGCQGHVSVLVLDTLPDFMLFLRLLHRKLEEGDFVRLPRARAPKADLKSLAIATLSTLPGVGEKLAQRLLERFGSIYRVVTASEEELASVLGERRAKRVYGFLRDEAKA
jgi:ERCC4-type nuclease